MKVSRTIRIPKPDTTPWKWREPSAEALRAFPWLKPPRYRKKGRHKHNLHLREYYGYPFNVSSQAWKEGVAKHLRFLRSGGAPGKWEVIALGAATSICHYSSIVRPFERGLQFNLYGAQGLSSLLTYTHTRLPWGNLAGTLMQRVDFSHSDFSHAAFMDVDASGACFAGCRLTGADFSRSRLRFVNFRGADLTGVDFENCDLTGADFTGARLRHLKMPGAVVEGARFDTRPREPESFSREELKQIADRVLACPRAHEQLARLQNFTEREHCADLLWRMFREDIFPLARVPELWSELVIRPARPVDVAALLGAIEQVPAGLDRLYPCWPEVLDRLVFPAYLEDPAAYPFIPDIERGLDLIRFRIGHGPGAPGSDLVEQLAGAYLAGEPKEVMALVDGGARLILFQEQWTSDFIERIGERKVWRRILMNAALAADYAHESILRLKDILLEADAPAFVEFIARLKQYLNEQERDALSTILALREDDDAVLAAAFERAPLEPGMDAKELIAMRIILNVKARGERVPNKYCFDYFGAIDVDEPEPKTDYDFEQQAEEAMAYVDEQLIQENRRAPVRERARGSRSGWLHYNPEIDNHSPAHLPALLEQVPEYLPRTRIYVIEKHPAGRGNICRIAGPAIGVKKEHWPIHHARGWPMVHLLTLDINEIPELRARPSLAGVRALAVFVSRIAAQAHCHGRPSLPPASRSRHRAYP